MCGLYDFLQGTKISLTVSKEMRIILDDLEVL